MPEDDATHAVACRDLGDTAYKIHPYVAWDPATRSRVLPRPAPVSWHIEVCRAGRGGRARDPHLLA
jgi:hypothetical protein